MSKHYTAMSGGDMLQALGDDAAKWAAAFREQHPELDEGELIGWFANAIENTWDRRSARLTRDPEAWCDYRRQVESHRRFWREVDPSEPNSWLDRVTDALSGWRLSLAWWFRARFQ